eukprot:snap_masked-scaffold_3-processed-gene-7.16-mRNA-1 protein AED:0.24 eAED:0.24 QI:0/-1/0/1/-1/1/1/0/281
MDLSELRKEDFKEEFINELFILREIYIGDNDNLSFLVQETNSKVSLLISICFFGSRVVLNFSANFPNEAPAIKFIETSLKKDEYERIQKDFKIFFAENSDISVFEIFEQVKSSLAELNETLLNSDPVETPSEGNLKLGITSKKEAPSILNDSKLGNILSGARITEKKSIFQGHVCKVSSASEAKEIYNLLCNDKKLSKATHNMMAYRIEITKQDKSIIVADNSDDGEAKAGSNLAELLEKLKVKNLLVVVSRWYGGIHLGPSRFKIIKKVAKEIVISFENR